MLTTAERFCDEMNAVRAIRERAFDDLLASSILVALEMSPSEICKRYCIGATEEPGEERLHFVDGSIAANAPDERWEVVQP